VEAKQDVKILAVTVLTSLDDADMRDLGFRCSAEEVVLSRARRALELGCEGVVSSGLEAPRLRDQLGERFLAVVPGVRPFANTEDDQKRVIDVKGAFLNGADYVVIGRPLRRAEKPLLLAESMQREIEAALEERSSGLRENRV